MKLTRFQYKVLKIYWRYHTTGFNVSQVLRECWWPWLLLAGLSALSCFIWSASPPNLGFLFAGLFAGALLRDISYCRLRLRIWPVTQEVYDWKRVAELIESHEKDTP
jgi:hypothetical protein